MTLLGTINTGKQGRTHLFTGSVILAGGILAIITGPFQTIILFRNEQPMFWIQLVINNNLLLINNIQYVLHTAKVIH